MSSVDSLKVYDYEPGQKKIRSVLPSALYERLQGKVDKFKCINKVVVF